MSKRTKYFGKEELVCLIPLNKESSKLIPRIQALSHKGKNEYSARFVYDTNYDSPFEDRIKNAYNNGNKYCFIFGENEVKNDGVTLKNLTNGCQEFVKCENIGKTLFP